MPRKTFPEPKRRAEVTVERRHVAAFARLLTALGLGDVRVEVDDTLEPLLDQAIERVEVILSHLTAETARANRLSNQAATGPQAVQFVEYGHNVQWRAVDADDGVVVRGEWVPSHEEGPAKQFLASELVNLGRDDLTPQRLVRCNHFHITSIATPDEQPSF